MTAEETAADRLRIAVGLHEFGVALHRQTLRRRHPEWSLGQLDAAMGKWLAGDPPRGRPAPRERLARIERLAAVPANAQ